LGGRVKDGPPIVLVTGGARSGKSRFAITRAESLGSPRVFLATAEARDDEMTRRIASHRAERGRRWQTVEEPLAIAAVLQRQRRGVVLIDCLTLWLANQMGECPSTNVAPAVDELVEALVSRRSAVVAVTNEVGLGIVPENALARAFRDATGFLNQRVAAIADEVFLLVAGQPLRVK
jgi:adenosylcobinamide kinase / adenosylcobinamide-phosphate guanylyltransferase